MRSYLLPGVLLIGTVLLVVSCAVTCLGVSEEDEVVHSTSSWCPNAFFNFGDSLSDTGNAVLEMPGHSRCENLPYGQAFFGKPTGRCTNGRLVIDFMLLAFKLPLLDPYLLPTSATKGRHGLNFAYGGATALKSDFNSHDLNYQVDEFFTFKNLVLQRRSEQLMAQSPNRLDQAALSTALYTICIGGNDLIGRIFAGVHPKAIMRDIVPYAVDEIARSVRTLYFQGARKFMIFNGPPAGCSTAIMTLLKGFGYPVDNLGCITTINEINQASNSALFKSVQHLRVALPQISITYFDYYAANLEILANPSKYGFNEDLKEMTCCGAPGNGELNWNPDHMCGQPEVHQCEDPDQYLVWDGMHWTEAFYRIIAKFVLNGKFSDPSTNITEACNLTFENFGHKTYDEVYCESCPLLFEE